MQYVHVIPIQIKLQFKSLDEADQTRLSKCNKR